MTTEIRGRCVPIQAGMMRKSASVRRPRQPRSSPSLAANRVAKFWFGNKKNLGEGVVSVGRWVCGYEAEREGALWLVSEPEKSGCSGCLKLCRQGVGNRVGGEVDPIRKVCAALE